MSNSSKNLSPLEAAQAASTVYGIRLNRNTDKIFKNTELNDKFIFGADSRFKGNSGIFRSKSGFGVIAKGTGRDHQGDVVIITRGTVTSADWYNNAMVKPTLSANKKLVHKGFNTIFNSFKNDLESQLITMNPTHVHCIGHSLGGSLATLIAEWVNTKEIGQAHVYTFGSPRVGYKDFSERLTFNLGAQQINRAYHKTDIVPMIPVWPYVHAPSPEPACFINSPGDHPGATYHDRELYISSVRNHKSWNSLRKPHPKTNLDNQVENWLDSDSPLSLTGNTISMINAAILYAIKKLALAGLQFIIGETVNMVDALSAFLAKAAHKAKEASSIVGNLIKRILRAIGKAFIEIKNITYTFVKWVLDSLSAAMHQTASMAVGMAHRFL